MIYALVKTQQDLQCAQRYYARPLRIGDTVRSHEVDPNWSREAEARASLKQMVDDCRYGSMRFRKP